MDWMIILSQLFELVLIPLLGGLATFLIILIRKKGEEISAKLDDDRKKEYVQLLTETITNCVSATSQTYVDSLKAQGKFDAEAQKVAFEKTYTAVFAILTDDAKVYLGKIYGDLHTYITQRIEAQVNANKGKTPAAAGSAAENTQTITE